MKVNQIVSEHKKGVRAKIYNKKATTKATGPVPLYGPGKQDAKLTPVKLPKDKAVNEEATITKADPATGVEITDQSGVKTTLPPDKASALMPDPDKPGEYDFNQTAVASASGTGAPAQPEGPKVGSKVEIKTAEGTDEEVEEVQSAVYPSRNAGTPAADQAAQQEPTKVQSAVYPSRNVRENKSADDILLQKMLAIAGLR